jgi:predicted nucleic acid-binding protein
LLDVYAGQVTLITPTAVYEESASPKLLERHPDARRIARAAEAGALRVENVTSRRRLPIPLGPGETATIRLYLARRADLVLSDDGRAIRACRLIGATFTTTPRVVVDLHFVGRISLVEARRTLEKLAVIGRYAPEIIAAALTALREK